MEQTTVELDAGRADESAVAFNHHVHQALVGVAPTRTIGRP